MKNALGASPQGTPLGAAVREAVDVIPRQLLFPGGASLSEQKQQLIEVLYQRWYTRSLMAKDFQPLPQPDYTQVYRVMHRDDDTWENGWIVNKVSSAGRLMVVQGEDARVIDPGDYFSVARPGLLPRPGEAVTTVARRDMPDEQPGFWITSSPAWFRLESVMVRLYWNTVPEGGARLVELVTKNLAATVPYSLKLPVDAAGYKRADAVVLYFDGSCFKLILPALKAIHTAMQDQLWPVVPGMTRALAPGLGLAEDPRTETESFGTQRCRLLAEGILVAHEQYPNDGDQFETAVRRYLIEAGVNALWPHLCPDSVADYDW
jgi:hypothetical protein